MNVLRGMWPAVPAGLALTLLALPNLVTEPWHSLLIAVVAVGLAVAVIRAYVASRIEPLVMAAERLARGDADVEIPVRRDQLGRRLASAVRDRKSTRLNSSHIQKSRMPSSA